MADKKRKWRKDEVDFDEHGRLVVSGEFAAKLSSAVEANGKLIVFEDPLPPTLPPPLNPTCLPPRDPDPVPNFMCDCIYELAWRNDGRPYGGLAMPEIKTPF